MIEVDMIPCGFCKKPVKTRWSVNSDGTNNGLLSDQNVVLIGDTVNHKACFDFYDWGQLAGD